MPPPEPLRENVVRVEAPRHRFTLLAAPGGDFLGVDDAGDPTVLREADDRVVWEEGPAGYRHVGTGQQVDVGPAADGDRLLTWRGQALGADGHPGARPASFRAFRGPDRLPSEYLRVFREQGWVCLPAVLDADTVDGLQRVAGCGRWSGRTYDRSVSALDQHPAVARASAESVSLWLTRRYMGTDEIRFAHPPSFAVLDRDDGERDVQESAAWTEITDRERRELESLLVYEIVGPRGRQAITVDRELTERRRVNAGTDAP